MTNADGTFKLTHVSGRYSAEVGKYTVVLAAPAANPGNFFELIPKRYTEGTGAVSIEIKKDVGTLEITLEKPQATASR